MHQGVSGLGVAEVSALIAGVDKCPQGRRRECIQKLNAAFIPASKASNRNKPTFSNLLKPLK